MLTPSGEPQASVTLITTITVFDSVSIISQNLLPMSA
jgi:hypothetical protein